MKTRAKIKSPRPRKPQSRLYIPSPRFVLVPFFGHQLRAVLEGEETWYVREDVLRVLSLNEAPYWNRRLFPKIRIAQCNFNHPGLYSTSSHFSSCLTCPVDVDEPEPIDHFHPDLLRVPFPYLQNQKHYGNSPLTPQTQDYQ